MRFSENWLRSWVDPDVDTDELCEQLTNAGLEVESADSITATFRDVVVVDVRTAEPVEDSDHLSVCSIFDGKNEFTVVCGAPNVRRGLRTAYAREGAILGANNQISTRRIGGIDSVGMLCSEFELGMGQDSHGILELDHSCQLGSDVVSIFGVPDSTISLDLTPNRGDCFSVRGIAREIGVINRATVTGPVSEAVPPSIDDALEIVLEDPVGCPIYLGRVVKDIDVGRTTPRWMQDRLIRSGLRPINPVVDVLNYVMIELGQPMHAFDLDRLSGRIGVRRGRDGERLLLLDGTELTLDSSMLAITDSTGPVALAGVMGGLESGVQESTKHLFLECAYFAPDVIMGTPRKIGIQSDASTRYERGVDFQLQREAMERASALLVRIAGGRLGPVTEAVSDRHVPSRKHVRLRRDRMNMLIGSDIDADVVTDAFRRLEFDPEFDTQAWQCTVPSHRFDIEIEEDLVEEVCRIVGYNSVPSRIEDAKRPLRAVPSDQTTIWDLKRRLIELGYQEAITYSFISEDDNRQFVSREKLLDLVNPMSADQSTMRTSLLAGLVRAVQRNTARQHETVRLFEVGMCFSTSGSSVSQQDKVAGIACGFRNPESWGHSRRSVDFFDIKGDVEQLLAISGSPFSVKATSCEGFHPGQTAALVVDSNEIGILGTLHPSVAEYFEVPRATVAFEVDVEPLLQLVRREGGHVSVYPSIRHDLSFIIGKEVSAATIEMVVLNSLKSYPVQFKLFDVYEGQGINKNEKSVTVGLTFQEKSRTLEEAEVRELVQLAANQLQRQIGARLRS